MGLQEQLDAFSAEVQAQIPPECQAVIHRTTEELRRSGLAARSVKVGDRAPAFALPNTKGQIFRSADLLSERHLAVSFYRGGW